METDIEKLLKTTIQAKVVEAFNAAPEVIEKLVLAAFAKPVNEYGAPPSGYHDKKMPYLEWLVGDEIRKAARDCVVAYMQEHREQIHAKIREALQSADLVAPIAAQLEAALSATGSWTVNLTVDRTGN